MANAASKVRNAFLQNSQDMTLTDLKEFIGDLKSNEISMALSYLQKQRYVTRESIPNDVPKKRKRVWLYKYYPTPLPKQESK
jgi:predicted transcriptional regulator